MCDNLIDQGVFTVCFSGTGCTRDEGEVTRIKTDRNNASDMDIYCPEAGYIPVRLHQEISGQLMPTDRASLCVELA